jgi:hypothetical protein
MKLECNEKLKMMFFFDDDEKFKMKFDEKCVFFKTMRMFPNFTCCCFFEII